MKVERPDYILRSISNKDLPDLSNRALSDVFDTANYEEIQIADGPFTRIATPLLPALGYDTPNVPNFISLENFKEFSTSQLELEDPLATPRTTINLFSTNENLLPIRDRNVGLNDKTGLCSLSTPRSDILNSLIKPTTPRPRGCEFSPFVLANRQKYLLTPRLIGGSGDVDLSHKFSSKTDDAVFKTPLLPVKSSYVSDEQDNFVDNLLSTPMLFPSNLQSCAPDILEMIDDNCTSLQFESCMKSYDVMSVNDGNVADYLLDLGNSMQLKQQPVLEKEQKYAENDAQKPEMNIISGPIRRGRSSKRLTSRMERQIKEKQKEKYAKQQKEKAAMSKQKRKDRFNQKQDHEDGIRRRVQRGGRCTRSLAKSCKKAGLAKSSKDVVTMLSKYNACSDEE